MKISLGISLNQIGVLPLDCWTFQKQVFQRRYRTQMEILEKLSLSACHFTGSIPSSIGNLTKLTFLSSSFNNFEGQIPNVFGNLNKLIMFDFSFNNFHGLLPSSAFNLTGFTYMALNDNHLGSPLPYNISGLSNFKTSFYMQTCLKAKFQVGYLVYHLWSFYTLTLV